jgi:fructokinase
MNRKKLFGGMEGGGTKFVCAVGSDPRNIIEVCQFPTTEPGETLGKAIAFFKKFSLSAIGIASFGPLDLDSHSPTFGMVTSSPKSSWEAINILDSFRTEFNLPLALETDVNAAAFGEYYWVPENHKLDMLAYFTIGTGIGAGIISNRRIVHGLTHPEAGHMRIPHNRKLDPYPGNCPFHGDCFEGLASGPALAMRWRKTADLLPDSHPAWDLEAQYIAYALVNTILLLSPQRIIMGGGVMKHTALFPTIRKKIKQILNNYVSSPIITEKMDDYIVPPSLGTQSGVLGAIALVKTLKV